MRYTLEAARRGYSESEEALVSEEEMTDEELTAALDLSWLDEEEE